MGEMARIVTADGWEAHRTIHARLDAWVPACLEVVEEPLRLHLRLRGLVEDLNCHMTFEERHVLPLYDALVEDAAPGGTPEMVRRDHDLLRTRLRELLDLSLHAACKHVDASLLRGALVDLDELLEHHDQREHDHMYPFLKDTLDQRESTSLLAALAEQVLLGSEAGVPLMDALVIDPWIATLTGRMHAWVAVRDAVLIGLGVPPELDAALQPLRQRTLPAPVEIADPDGRVAVGLQRMLARADAKVVAFMEAPIGDAVGLAQAERHTDAAVRAPLRFMLRAFAALARDQATLRDDA